MSTDIARKEIRNYEINLFRSFFKSELKVLELGGGNGFQASVLKSWGCDVTSVDIEMHSLEKRFFPVMKYDGKNLPFKNECFDVIISSNVLEHVKKLPELLLETRRVMKSEGISIHIMPSVSWRWWTSVAHYPYLLIRLLGVFSRSNNSDISDVQNLNKSKKSYWQKLFSGPHGEFPNAFFELFYFSQHSWKKLFLRNNFSLEQVSTNELFYTGYHLLNKVSLDTRKKLSGVLGASCNIFILKKNLN